MCSRRVLICSIVILLFFSGSSLADNSLLIKSKRLTILGMLTDDMTVGTENSGWTIQLNPVIIVEGRQISSIQIKSPNSHQLESLEDKFVQAKGKLTFISNVDTEERPLFEVWSIKEHRGRKGFVP